MPITFTMADGEEIHLYGPWRNPEKPEELTPDGQKIGKWLGGEDMPIDAELIRLIREEFARQERFRQDVRLFVHQAIGAMSERVEQQKADGGLPNGPGQQFDHGYKCGAYKAYRDCQQILVDILNASSLELCK